jgi:hypothetical protein
MNDVGECVCRFASGSSPPRGARAPPITVTSSSTDFRASYVSARSCAYACAAASESSVPNWGSQNRFRFGSFPTTTSRTSGIARTIDAAYAAKARRA